MAENNKNLFLFCFLDNLHKKLDSAFIATTHDKSQKSGEKPDKMPHKIISFASSEQLVQQLSIKLDQLKASEIFPVALDSFDISKFFKLCKRISSTLNVLLTQIFFLLFLLYIDPSVFDSIVLKIAYHGSPSVSSTLSLCWRF